MADSPNLERLIFQLASAVVGLRQQVIALRHGVAIDGDALRQYNEGEAYYRENINAFLSDIRELTKGE